MRTWRSQQVSWSNVTSSENVSVPSFQLLIFIGYSLCLKGAVLLNHNTVGYAGIRQTIFRTYHSQSYILAHFQVASFFYCGPESVIDSTGVLIKCQRECDARLNRESADSAPHVPHVTSPKCCLWVPRGKAPFE